MRIGIFADVDLNLIDGSSLWVQSVAEAITRYTPHRPLVISKRSVRPDRPIPRTLRRDGIDLHDPSTLGVGECRGGDELLHHADLMNLTLDVLLVRGLNAVLAAVAAEPPAGQLWGYVTEFDRNTIFDDERLRKLAAVAAGVDRFFVQTIAARDFVAEVPGVEARKLAVLPPMLPSRYASASTADGRVRRIVYGGKFAPDWGILDLERVAHQLAERGSGREPLPVTLFGDKIHDPTENRSFSSRIETLKADPLVDWRGAVTRDEVVSTLKESRYAWAWRTPQLENATLETSSKVLEACAAGALPLCYPNEQNRELLGDDYPLYIEHAEEAKERLIAIDSDPRQLRIAQNGVAQAVEHHRDSTIIKDLFGQLLPARIAAHSHRCVGNTAKPKLLVAGHDLKFATGIIQYLRLLYDVNVERWRGHDDSELRVRSTESGADIIWCEWCLGNAVHYSTKKNPDQRLIIRFHLQEFETEYPDQVEIDNVERVIFVNDYHREQAQARYGWPAEKLITIPNYIDAQAYFFDKPDDAYFNIGMIGCVPARKRLDRALDLIEKLREHDDRWTLWIKGKRPTDYPWLRKRDEEMDYYRSCEQRITRSKTLRDGVRHVPAGGDVPRFLSRMGWVISPSDFESFHLAVIEGGAAGACPVIWNWDAAPSIYDPDWIVESVFDAQQKLLGTTLYDWRPMADEARRRVSARFDANAVTSRFLEVCSQSCDRA